MSGYVTGAGSMVQGVMGFAQGRRRAKLLKQDAEEAGRLAAIDAQQIRTESRRAIGEAVARQGASGFAMDESALAVIADIAQQYDFRARSARYEGYRTRRRLNFEATEAKAGAALSLLKGVTDAGAAIIGAQDASGEG